MQVDQSRAGLWDLRSCPRVYIRKYWRLTLGAIVSTCWMLTMCWILCWRVCTHASFHPHNSWGRYDYSSHFTDKENESQRRQVACPESLSKAKIWIEASSRTYMQNHCIVPPLRKPFDTFLCLPFSFALISDKRYQQKEPLISSVHTKVKGTAEVKMEILENGIKKMVSTVFDTADYTFPLQVSTCQQLPRTPPWLLSPGPLPPSPGTGVSL